MFRPPTPGVFEQPARPPPGEAAVRDDIAAFIGLAERGPVDIAIRLERWEEFRARFGGRSDAFFLADAVLGFFLNGGRTCYAVRVLHREPLAGETLADVGRPARAACRALTIDTLFGAPPTWMAAQRGVPDPGAWGNRLAVSIRFALRELQPAPAQASPSLLRFDATNGLGRSPVAPGELIWEVGSATPMRLVAVHAVAPTDPLSVESQLGAAPKVDVTLAAPLVFAAGARLAVVEAVVEALTADGQREHHEHLGLDSRHPRYLPAVLAADSQLVALEASGAGAYTTLLPSQLFWAKGSLAPSDELAVAALGRDPDPATDALYRGRDGLEKITRDDFFDRLPDFEKPWRNRGLQQLDALRDVSLVVIPDLVLPSDLPPPKVGLDRAPVEHRNRTRFVCAPAEPGLIRIAIAAGGQLGAMQFTWQLPGGAISAPVPTAAGPRFQFQVPGQPFMTVSFPAGLYVVPDSYDYSATLGVVHLGTGVPVPTVTTAEPAPPPVRPYNLLDPSVTGMWQDLADAETRLVAWCTDAGDKVCLLAPPPSADARAAILWRARFASPFAAAYFPWLEFGDPVVHPPVRLAPPTGVAAGIIARSEIRSGVGRSPANLPAFDTSGLATAISADEWALLHAVCLDVFRPLPGEIRLLGARTLSGDVPFRYLHVRRLVTHVRRTIERRMTWVVFEPHIEQLWPRVTHDVEVNVLRPLFERGAFAGATRDDSYFVRCDAALNPPEQVALGRLTCEIGIAPNLPAEYIVFRLAASRDDGIVVEEVQ